MDNSKQAATPKTSKSQRPAPFLVHIALLLAIIACLASAWNWYSHHQANNSINHSTQRLQQSWQSFQVATQSDIKALKNNFDNQQQQLLSIKLNLSNALTISSNSQRFRTLNKAVYLIHMAQLQLTIDHDPLKSASLLIRANKLIASLHDDSLFLLLQHIDKTVLSLKKVKAPNLPSLLSKLDHLSNLIRSLSSNPQPAATPTPQLQAKPQVNHDRWYQKIGHLFSGLKDLVIIRHRAQPISALPSLPALSLARYLIQSKISIAEWATLHRQQALFQQSMQQAITTLRNQFSFNTNAKPIIQQMLALKALDVDPNLPSLTTTLSLANDALQPKTTTPEKATPARPLTPKKHKTTATHNKLGVTL